MISVCSWLCLPRPGAHASIGRPESDNGVVAAEAEGVGERGTRIPRPWLGDQIDLGQIWIRGLESCSGRDDPAFDRQQYCGDLDGALSDLQEALRRNPRYEAATLNLAWLYVERGEVEATLLASAGLRLGSRISRSLVSSCLAMSGCSLRNSRALSLP